MSDPVFEVGQPVIAELSPDDSFSPFRWDFDMISNDWIDEGYSGNIVEGWVDRISVDLFVAHLMFDIEGELIQYDLPLRGHVCFREGQYALPGFPIPKFEPKLVTCTCGGDKLAKLSGYYKATHMPSCDKYNENFKS